MILIFKLWLILGLSVTVFSQQNITDVPTSDAAYPAIKRSIDSGYLTLMDGTKFLPDQNITRKEMALLLSRLDELSNSASLSDNDIIELKFFKAV